MVVHCSILRRTKLESLPASFLGNVHTVACVCESAVSDPCCLPMDYARWASVDRSHRQKKHTAWRFISLTLGQSLACVPLLHCAHICCLGRRRSRIYTMLSRKAHQFTAIPHLLLDGKRFRPVRSQPSSTFAGKGHSGPLKFWQAAREWQCELPSGSQDAAGGKRKRTQLGLDSGC